MRTVVHPNSPGHLTMWKKSTLLPLLGSLFAASVAAAQQKVVTGTVTNEQGSPMMAVSVVIKGTRVGTNTNADGRYSIPASVGQVLVYRFIGTAPEERTVGSADVIDVQLKRVATKLNEVVVTALGQTTAERALGASQQTVQGADIAQTQRLNFVNALQGRVAGVEVINTSGVPGASSAITIRGVSSISSSNQPMMIIDGLPLDNKVMSSGTLASGRSGSANSFENRSVDFTNRGADLNPNDIESIVVLKGPEASALYGIDAANGAIVITTKRGTPGTGGIDYSVSFKGEKTSGYPELQKVYGINGTLLTAPLYFGDPIPAGTPLYDNVRNFFQTGLSQQHNLAFSGGSADRRLNYRVSGAAAKEDGIVPHTGYDRYNITGASTVQPTTWLTADLSMMYSYAVNHQPFKGQGSPLLGLLVWPQFDDARNYLSPAGTRIRSTILSAGAEYDNPYFSVNKNKIDSKNNRILTNLGISVTPFRWGFVKTNIGIDAYTNQNMILRHPESWQGFAWNGVLDVGDDITRNLSSQTILNLNSYTINDNFSVTALVGNAIREEKSTTDATVGQDFLDPNFVSINNTNQRFSLTTTTQRRVMSGFGQATVDFRKYLYLTVTGRNDWTSTIPRERNSFFYPSFSASFIFSDAFPSIARFTTGKVRAAYAEVGRDAKPYSYRPALQYKTTSFGGYGYDFWGPNRKLKPEFAKSYEVGSELSFLKERLGVDVTYYSKRTFDQIVQNVRGSYGTGFILFNLNGASTKNAGLELTVSGVPKISGNFEWDVLANFDKSRGRTLTLPNALPESYNSDSWVYGNVRNGTQPGLSTRSLTGAFYLRNKSGQLLIDPTTGLPFRNANFVDGGYDRQPDYTVGLTNSFRYKKVSLNALLDIRRGGDVLNATQHYLTTLGLTPRTLDRWTPRVIPGVLRDGKENSNNPTPNGIVVVPAQNTSYYTNMSEELFIEQDINWLRLRDITLTYELPRRILPNASIFITGTDLFLFTNYSGLDPIASASSPATGGSGSVGIDYGGFPTPRAISFGTKVRF
ncbi:MAG TPA: SusC/RagA family TonB-linked outer membrane protein [Gemmatimonadaceae bacterium]